MNGLSNWNARLSQADSMNSFNKLYLPMWIRYKCLFEHFDGVLSYLERFWIERERQDCRAKGIDGPMYIRQLLYSLWASVIIVGSKDKLFAIIETCWDVQRPIDIDDIKLIVESFKILSVPIRIDSSKKAIDSGVHLFEECLLPCYNERLAVGCATHLAQLFSTHPDGSLSLRQTEMIKAVWDEEILRATTILGTEVEPAIKGTLKTHLINAVTVKLCELMEGFLLSEDDPTATLKLIFNVIVLRKGSIPSIAPFFEHGLQRRANLRTSGASDFEGLAKLFSATERWLSESFASNSNIRSARDRAITELFKSVDPAAFAQWFNDAMAGDLNLVLFAAKMVIFLSDRFAFFQAYHRLLSTRLISNATNMELETQVIQLLKGSNSSLIHFFERMVADVSSEHCSKQKEPKEKRAKSSPVQFKTLVLTKGSWPIDVVEGITDEVVLPSDYVTYTKSFESQYSSQFPKRNLYWHPILSNVEIDVYFASGVYRFLLSVVQLSVFECLGYPYQDMASISLKTGLISDIIMNILEPLVSIGLVKKEGKFLCLNIQFSHPVEYIDLVPGHPHAKPEPASQVSGPDHAVITRSIHLLQCALMRALKTAPNQKMKLPELVLAVHPMVERWKPIVETEEVQTALDNLVSREFVKSQDNSVYQYIP